MPASEYGSYYWCVVLKDAPTNSEAGAVYLHADAMNIDTAGNLQFTSAGRRPVGAQPTQMQNGNSGDQEASGKKNADKDEKDKGQQGDGLAGMIYMAFASGSWKAVYAAKLRDGSPACVEHWISERGGPESALLHGQHGAAGFEET